MKSGMQILKERADAAGITLGKSINGQVFVDLGLPMVVACKCCGMTMSLPSAQVDEEGYTWCSDCAPRDEDEVSAEDLAEYQGRY